MSRVIVWSLRFACVAVFAVLVPARAAEPAKGPGAAGNRPTPTKLPEAARPDISAVLRALNRPERTVSAPALQSSEIDILLDKALAAAKAPPTRRTTDEEFVRRVCLDIIGKPLTPEQLQTFLLNKRPNRRAELIDYLLASPDYGTNWARYWRDVIAYHATNNQLRVISYPSFVAWLGDQLNKDRPWDEIATAMLTANGTANENGAVSFLLAHAENNQVPAVELAGEASRIFLGVQIACAQCHDHPNDPWKREQFHEFAAFFAGIRAVRKMPMEPEVVTAPKARHTMPDLKDPQKSTPVEPRFFLASSETPVPKGLSPQERRMLAASYITGQDNPWFARAFVNRVWYALMGEGFYSPVDDLGPTREAKDPEVLDALASAFSQGGYDVKWLLRTILNTKAYQREGRATNTAAGKIPFAANCPSRLRADQIFEALAQAIGFGPPPGADKPNPNRPATKANLARPGFMNNPRVQFLLLYGVDPSTPNDDVLGTIPQALFFMNSPALNNRIRAGKGTVLGELLAATPDNRAVLEALYMRTLARHPTAKEVDLCGHYLRMVGDRREAFEDILWSLINSTEFVSRR